MAMPTSSGSRWTGSPGNRLHWGVSRSADEVLWALDVAWERATGSEVDVLVGWMKTARNPQRRRTRLTTPARLLGW